MIVTEKQLEVYLYATTHHDRSQWKNYKSRLKKINTSLKKFTVQSISEFILSLSALSSSTQNGYFDMLCYIGKILKVDYMENFHRPRIINRKKYILYPYEMRVFLEAAYQKSRRMALACELSLRQGLRYSEIRNLKSCNIIGNELVLQDTKSGEDQTVYLPLDLVQKIKLLQNGEYVFANTNGLLSNHGINKFVKDMLRQVGITKPLTFHDLRHSAASDLINNDVNMYVVKEFMRHKRLSTTEKYCHIYPYKLLEVTKRHSLSTNTWTREDIIKEVVRFQNVLLTTPYKSNIEYKKNKIVLSIRMNEAGADL